MFIFTPKSLKPRAGYGLPSSSFHRRANQALFCQVVHNLLHALLDAQLIGSNGDLRGLWCFIWCRDSGEILDHTSSRLCIQTFGVPLLRLLQGHINVDFNEGQCLIASLTCIRMKVTGNLSIRPVW